MNTVGVAAQLIVLGFVILMAALIGLFLIAGVIDVVDNLRVILT